MTTSTGASTPTKKLLQTTLLLFTQALLISTTSSTLLQNNSSPTTTETLKDLRFHPVYLLTSPQKFKLSITQTTLKTDPTSSETTKINIFEAATPLDITANRESIKFWPNINSRTTIIPLKDKNFSDLNVGIPCLNSYVDLCKFDKINQNSKHFLGENYEARNGQTVMVPTNATISFKAEVFENGPLFQFDFLTKNPFNFLPSNMSVLGLSAQSGFTSYVIEQYLESNYFYFGLRAPDDYSLDYDPDDYQRFNESVLWFNGYDKGNMSEDLVMFPAKTDDSSLNGWVVENTNLSISGGKSDVFGGNKAICFSWYRTSILTLSQTDLNNLKKSVFSKLCKNPEKCISNSKNVTIDAAPTLSLTFNQNNGQKWLPKMSLEIKPKHYLYTDKSTKEIKFKIQAFEKKPLDCGGDGNYLIAGLDFFAVFLVVFTLSGNPNSPMSVGIARFSQPFANYVFWTFLTVVVLGMTAFVVAAWKYQKNLKQLDLDKETDLEKRDQEGRFEGYYGIDEDDDDSTH